jgi:hypothetical protein
MAKARAATVGACVATIAFNKVWFQSKMALDRLELMFATASLEQAHEVVVGSMARQASRMREQTCRFDGKRSVGIFIARSGQFMMVPLVAGTWKKGRSKARQIMLTPTRGQYIASGHQSICSLGIPSEFGQIQSVQIRLVKTVCESGYQPCFETGNQASPKLSFTAMAISWSERR